MEHDWTTAAGQRFHLAITGVRRGSAADGSADSYLRRLAEGVGRNE